MRRAILFAAFSLFVSGCATLEIERSISQFNSVASDVSLGDKKSKVLEILGPTQEDLSDHARKRKDYFMSGPDIIEIYYFRSSRQPDGLTTDDEFTPYMFKNDVLVSIGWAALGGPKTHGQVVQPAPVVNENITIQTR